MIRVLAQSNGRTTRIRISPNPRASCDRFDWRETAPGGPIIDPLARDLLRIAQAIHLTDRAVRRSMTLGKRIRYLEITIPVSRPDHWSAHAEPLEKIASFVSADHWRITFSQGRGGRAQPRTRPPVERDGVVALFSGGLDSLCGAALRARDDNPTCFVTHSPPGDARVRDLLDCVWDICKSSGDLVRASFRLRPHLKDSRQKGARFPEPTRRTRPLYFVLLAASVARHLGRHRVQMSENGALAMNLPFRCDAYGGTVARQAHCHMLLQTAEWLDCVVPMSKRWELFNPLQPYTKGEACGLVGAVVQLARRTESCEYVGQQAAVIRKWKSSFPRRARSLGDGRQCGACLPCVVRRSAMKAARIEDPASDYFFNAPAMLADWRRGIRPRGERPPLVDAVLTHPIYISSFARMIENVSLREFVVRFLPELRLLSATPGISFKIPTDAHRLAQRFGKELLAFLEG